MSNSEAMELSFEWNGLHLAGSLHLPSGAGPHPAVLMAQGSGPADRDSDGFFGPIRETFLGRDVATFSFDKPGCGQSTGDWRHYGLGGRAEQAIAALDVLRNRQEIDEERVGFWGHSQGGWLVQKLAGSSCNLAFAIANSAPTIGISQQILYDCEHTMRHLGRREGEIQEALDLTRSLQQAATDGVDFATVVDQLLQPASGQSWFGNFPTIDGALDWEHQKLLITDDFEPLAALRNVSCPFLAIYGGLDPLLPPWQGAEESRKATGEATSSDATVIVFPRGDHRMQNPVNRDFVDGYLDLLRDWIYNRAHPQ